MTKRLSLSVWVFCCLVAFSASILAQDEGPHSLIFVKQNSKPKYYEDNAQGLCGEIYSALIAGLAAYDIKVEVLQTNYPIKRLLNMMEAGDAHVFCGAGRNAAREQMFVYSKLPVYSVSNVVSARGDASIEISSMDDMAEQELVIGALFGTSSAKWLKTHEGLRVSDKFDSPEEGLASVASGKIDVFYYHDLGLNYLTRTSHPSLKVLPVKFRTVPQWLLYSKEADPKLIKQLDAELAIMTNSGALKKIQQKYLSAP